jgi:hypothetical protein
MKRLVVDDNESGLDGLLGETVTLFCLNYIYTGTLAGVNDRYVLLTDPKIVYETGAFDVPAWTDAQALPNDLYVMLGCVESFGVVK